MATCQFYSLTILPYGFHARLPSEAWEMPLHELTLSTPKVTATTPTDQARLLAIIEDIGGRILEVSGEKRATSFLLQRLSFAV